VFKRWFASFKKPESAEAVLDLERDIQQLRLELDERGREIAQLKAEVQRQRNGASARVTAELQTQLERLLRDAAAPVAQMLTQAHLLEVEGRPVQARDVLMVARRLLRVLEDHGLMMLGEIGETVAFDPNFHDPLNVSTTPRPGQAVMVRVVGMTFQGKVLRKAGVDAGEGA